jgi:hypothetical protein
MLYICLLIAISMQFYGWKNVWNMKTTFFFLTVYNTLKCFLKYVSTYLEFLWESNMASEDVPRLSVLVLATHAVIFVGRSHHSSSALKYPNWRLLGRDCFWNTASMPSHLCAESPLFRVTSVTSHPCAESHLCRVRKYRLYAESPLCRVTSVPSDLCYESPMCRVTSVPSQEIPPLCRE